MIWTQILWLVLFVFFILLEAVTVALLSVWFCAGSLAALAVALLWPEKLVVQMLVFVAVSILAFIAIRPLAKKRLSGKSVATNADANIGKTCQVVVEIQPSRFGRVKLEGLEWMARSQDILPVGTWCRVVAIEGAKLVVEPLPVAQ